MFRIEPTPCQTNQLFYTPALAASAKVRPARYVHICIYLRCSGRQVICLFATLICFTPSSASTKPAHFLDSLNKPAKTQTSQARAEPVRFDAHPCVQAASHSRNSTPLTSFDEVR